LTPFLLDIPNENGVFHFQGQSCWEVTKRVKSCAVWGNVTKQRPKQNPG
jgi:hypothetical protein